MNRNREEGRFAVALEQFHAMGQGWDATTF